MTASVRNETTTAALTPPKTAEHLGFTCDSNKMLVSLPQTKIDTTVLRAKLALKEGGMTVGDVRSLLGSLESLRLVGNLAPLHPRRLSCLVLEVSGT